MSSFKVEDNEIGEVGSMFVLTSKDEKFIALVESGSMAYVPSARVRASQK